MNFKNQVSIFQSYAMISSLFVSEDFILTGILGATRVRKGMPRSFPSGLLTPTVPCCIIY